MAIGEDATEAEIEDEKCKEVTSGDDDGDDGGVERVTPEEEAETNIQSCQIELSKGGSLKLDTSPEIANNHISIADGGGDIKITREVPLRESIKDDARVKNKEEKKRQKGNRGLIRHIVALLALSSIVLANMNRQAFNQALVDMTRQPKDENPVHLYDNSSNTSNSTLPIKENFSSDRDLIDTITTTMPSTVTTTFTSNAVSEYEELAIEKSTSEPIFNEDDRFDWSGSQIGYLQSAFSYGYMPLMILGGRMSELYGAKWVVFVSGFGSALCCVLAPIFAHTNYYLLLASRVIMGLCQTGVSPALYAMLSRWLPPDESSVYLPMIKVGVMVGFMLGSLVSGFFTWKMTFYVVGFIGLLWSILWALMATSDPCEHRLLSKNELDYIRQEIGRLNKGRKQSMNTRKKAAPWLKMLTNPVIIAFMFAKFTVKLSTDTQTMQIPMYLDKVFHMPKESNSVLNSTNFAIQGIFTGLVAWVAKEFVVRQSFGLSKTGVRRLFQGICNFGMALAYVLITFNMSSITIIYCTVILLSVASMFGAGGETVTPVDLSTEYSATIMAIANSTANLSGMVLPLLVSFVLANKLDSPDRWNVVWWIVAGIIATGGLVYTWQVKAEIQDFNEPSKKKKIQKHEPVTIIELKVKSQENSN